MQLSAVHLLFVIIIIIALCADTLTIPVALGLIAAAVLLFVGLTTRNDDLQYEGATAAPSDAQNNAAAPSDVAEHELYNNFYDDVPWQNQSVLNYPQSSIEHQSLNTSYGTCYEPARPVIGYSGAELDNTVDSNLALLSQKRQRDKKASDGWALKDADYFRHNYDWELDDYENKPWWGRAEY